jgi:drug/metabolite transporter (DMT)-like permease
MDTGRERIVVAAFAGNALFAGGNAVAIRFSNRELDPLWGAGLRFTLAASLMCALMIALRAPFPRGRAMTGALLWGVFQFAGAFGFAYYAFVHVHAGLGQIVLSLVPLATLLLAVSQGQERMRGAAVLGTILGLAGVALIARDPLGESVPLLAVLALLASAVCFAQAAVFSRRFPPVHPVATNAVGMVVGAAILLGASALFRETWELPDQRATWLAVGYVVVVGSIAVFLLYLFVLQHWDASRAAYVMVLIPFVTVVLSAWLDAEPIRPSLVLGGTLVISGVYIGALRPARAKASSPVV